MLTKKTEKDILAVPVIMGLNWKKLDLDWI